MDAVQGTRAAIKFTDLLCSSDGQLQPSTGTVIAPPPCDWDPVTQQCVTTLPDGGTVIQDEWLPSIGFTNSGVPRVAMYWYGTRDDINNNKVATYMMASEDYGATWSLPARLTTNSGHGLVWPVDASLTWDYQTLGASFADGNFLAVWAGDARDNLTAPNIYSALLTH